MPDYGNPSYWDERYAAENAVFDWYQDYRELKPHIEKYLQRSQDFEILIPGCGCSKLGVDLYDDGYLNITNIDISSVVVSQMNDRYADREEMEYTVMDARRLEFIPDNCFDLIIDKALFDSLLCGENNMSNVQAYLSEMYRILKNGSYFMVISHGVPTSRMSYLTNTTFASGSNSNKVIPWTVEYFIIPKPSIGTDFGSEEVSKDHYIYVCKKN